MQKVVGSSPIIRSREGPAQRGVFLLKEWRGARTEGRGYHSRVSLPKVPCPAPVDRGLNPERTILSVIDGSKACARRSRTSGYRGTMNAGRLRVVDDVSLADWIAPRLSGGFGAVGLTLPRGYPAYARICHPAMNRVGEPVTWSEVG